jgi:hypothetical protein
VSEYDPAGNNVCLCGHPKSEHRDDVCPWDREIEETLDWQLMTNAERAEFKRRNLWVSVEELCGSLDDTWIRLPSLMLKQGG